MVIERALRWIVLSSIFALPFVVFIVSTSLFFPFITGKNFAFRILVEIMAASYLTLALTNPEYRPRKNWILAAFAIFIVVVALADAFGAYPFKSFWSNFERMDGFVTLAHLFLYFLVASNVLNTEKLWRAFWHTTLGASLLMALYGILQVAGIASLNPGFSSAARIDATFGNPIYLAVYMLFHVGIAAMLWVRYRQETSKKSWLPIFYGVVLALDALVIFLTGTRGTMLGLVGGFTIFLLLISLLPEVAAQVRRIAIGTLVGLVAIAGIFFLVRDQSFVQSVPFLQRLATISLEDNTTKARLMNWGMAWEGVKERPILGWGQENYAVVFDKHYNPGMYAQEQWFDRVHNIIFDWLIAAGFLGLISYISLFAFALWYLWKGQVFGPYERSVLTGLLAAYFFHNLFVFDNIGSYIMFTSLLAYIAWRAGSAPLPFPQVSKKLLPVVALCAVIVVWGSAWYVNAAALAQNRALLEALKPHPSLEENLELFKKAIGHGALGTQEAREQLAQISAQLARAESIPVSIKQDFAQTAAQELTLMSKEAPLNARPVLFLGVLLRSYGEYEGAEVVLQKARELSPKKQTILFEIAATHAAQGDIPSMLAAYKEAYELAPEFLDARLFYAATLIRSGQDALGEELLEPVRTTGAADPRIAAAYIARGRFDKLVSLWREHIEANAEDYQAYFTLAAAYYKAGNRTEAIRVLETVSGIAPHAKAQADEVIAQIKSGTLTIE